MGLVISIGIKDWHKTRCNRHFPNLLEKIYLEIEAAHEAIENKPFYAQRIDSGRVFK